MYVPTEVSLLLLFGRISLGMCQYRTDVAWLNRGRKTAVAKRYRFWT